MNQRIFELLIIAFGFFVILERDWMYEKLFPDVFWKQKIVALEKRERRDLWRIHREEWRLKQVRLDLSFALSVAQDEAQCFEMDSAICIEKAKEPFVSKLKGIEKDLEAARSAYAKTQMELKAARSSTL